MKIHPEIHVSNLNPYHPDPDDDQRNVITRPSIDLKQRDTKEIEEILADKVRKIGRRRIREFLVKWKNLPTEDTVGNAPKIWTLLLPTLPGLKIVG